MKDNSIAIIVPCYNEAKRINKNVFIDFAGNNKQIQLCFVNDGSTDNTKDILLEIEKSNPNNVICINLSKNVGKASAIREAMLQLVEKDINWVGFFDADLATPLEEILEMVKIIETNKNIKLLMGARWQRLGSKIDRNILRFYIGRVFATLSSISLDLKVYDTQCGAKIFNREIIPVCFKEKFISKWLFDIEILYRIKSKYGKMKTTEIIEEFPLRKWKEITDSKLKLKDFIIFPFDLMRIAYFYKRINNS